MREEINLGPESPIGVVVDWEKLLV